MNKKSINLFLIVTDGKPGHQTQSEGVLKLLTHNISKSEYEVEYLCIKTISKYKNLFLRFFLNYFNISSHLKSYLDIPSIDKNCHICIISAGGDTIVPNVLLKKYLTQNKYNVKNIILSSLRGVSANHFDTVFTVNSKLNNHESFLYYPISPNKMVFSASVEHNYDSKINKKILILIGADTKDVKIGTAENWFNLIKSIKTQYPLSEVILTTSRRTCREFEKELLALLLECSLTRNDQYYMYNTGEQIKIADFISSSDFVLISQDSGSMVSEVIMAEKKALLVGDPDQLTNNTMQNYFKNLVDRQMLDYVTFNEIHFEHKLKSMKVQNHSAILAEQLKIKLSLL